MKWLILTGLLMTQNATAKPSKKYMHQSFAKAAGRVGVPIALLKAICWAESNHRVKAFVFSDGGKNNHAIGMCQVTYATARELGLRDTRCKEDFRKRKSERSYANCKLFGPYTNAYYAALYLKSRLDKYGDSWISATAAYNTGSLKTCKTGKVYRRSDRKVLYKCEKGGLLNQVYVDRVLNVLGQEY